MLWKSRGWEDIYKVQEYCIETIDDANKELNQFTSNRHPPQASLWPEYRGLVPLLRLPSAEGPIRCEYDRELAQAHCPWRSGERKRNSESVWEVMARWRKWSSIVRDARVIRQNNFLPRASIYLRRRNWWAITPTPVGIPPRDTTNYSRNPKYAIICDREAAHLWRTWQTSYEESLYHTNCARLVMGTIRSWSSFARS